MGHMITEFYGDTFLAMKADKSGHITDHLQTVTPGIPGASSEPLGSEMLDARLRLFLAGVFALWYLTWTLLTSRTQAMPGLEIAAIYLTFSLLYLVASGENAIAHRWLHMAGNLIDQAVCILAMIVTGKLALVVAWAMALTSISTGIRFGMRGATMSSAVAVTGLILLAIFDPYWHTRLPWVISLMMLNTAVPAHIMLMLWHVEKSRSRLVEHADRMEKMALRDFLTELPNRSALFAAFAQAAARTHRMGHGIALLYFDLDGFKAVNDSHSHAVGDLLLKEVARRVRNVLRDEDILARLGGDEFVILMQVPDFTWPASGVPERVIQAIASITQVCGHPINLGASVGGVLLRGTDATRLGADQVIHAADKNMYTAKQRGKNQVVLTELPYRNLHMGGPYQGTS